MTINFFHFFYCIFFSDFSSFKKKEEVSKEGVSRNRGRKVSKEKYEKKSIKEEVVSQVVSHFAAQLHLSEHCESRMDRFLSSAFDPCIFLSHPSIIINRRRSSSFEFYPQIVFSSLAAIHQLAN